MSPQATRLSNLKYNRRSCEFYFLSWLARSGRGPFFLVTYRKLLAEGRLGIWKQSNYYNYLLSDLTCNYLEPKWPLFLKVNPPKQGLFQPKQGSFGFQVALLSNSNILQNQPPGDLHFCASVSFERSSTSTPWWCFCSYITSKIQAGKKHVSCAPCKTDGFFEDSKQAGAKIRKLILTKKIKWIVSWYVFFQVKMWMKFFVGAKNEKSLGQTVWKTLGDSKRWVFCIPTQKQWKGARWTPTSYKWSYNPYKWPYKWVTGVISPTNTNRLTGGIKK